MMSLLRRQFNLTGITDPAYRFTFGKLVGRFLRRRPCEQNAVAGIGDAGILGEGVFVKNLFEKKK
jgi:hypothetical protein